MKATMPSRTRAQRRLITHLLVTDAKNLAVILLLIFGWPWLTTSSALAQVTTTINPTTGVGSLGTTVTADGNTVQITGGTRPGNGTNLFHSFDQFNVGHPDTAQFLNTTPSLPTYNILGRVTSGNPSSIFGTIDTMSYPQANLFLMNPAGIIFGPNATLDVSGSVSFTTADYLRLAGTNGSNAGIFHADTTATSLLTSASVAAFGFLGSNPAAIAVQGSTLEMQPGQSISLVGGNITIQSGMLADKADSLPPPTAPGKQVYIASVASPGEILAVTLAPAANINEKSPGILGTVEISQGSKIDTSNNDGGTIRIRGGQLVVDGSHIFAGSGGISFDATSISIKNSALIGTYTTVTANAGNIIFDATRDIEMDSNARVESQTFIALKDAGNIIFRTNQGNVTFANEATVTSQAFDGGRNTGSIEIDAQNGNIRLENSSRIFPSAAQGTGKIGGVRITANNLELLKESRIDSDNFSTQVAGNIDIQLRGLLRLTGNSEIETTAVETAPAANLIIKAQEIRIADGSKLSADTEISSSGAGGNISIRGPQGPSDSVLIDGTGSGIFTDTKGTGPGGAIDLSARSLTIQNSGTISAGTASTATGGSITVNTTDHVTMTIGASITASSTGPGNAGNIFINAGQQLDLMGKSSITTEAKQASGGDIYIQAVDRVRLVNSSINTSVFGGDGNGGNITIDPNVVVLQGSQVKAEAFQGVGGDITITTPLFLRDSTSEVSAFSPFGLNGTVTIQSPTSNLSGSLGPLASKPSQAQALLTQRCAALASGQASSFVVAGREQLPSDPGGWLSSPLAFAALGESLDAGHAIAAAPAAVPIVTQDANTVSLRRLTPAWFLMASFADSEATGCHS